MNFILNPLWWQLFLTALFIALLLTIREIYRFPLLNTKIGKLTTFGSCILVPIVIIVIGFIFFKIGLLAGVISFCLLIFFVAIVYQVFQKYFIDKCKEIDDFCNNIFVKNILKEFKLDPNILKDILNRLLLLGNKKAIESIKDFHKLKIVLQILTQSPENWTEEDKFIQISNYLEYGKL